MIATTTTTATMIIIFLFASGPSKIAIALSLSGVLRYDAPLFFSWAGRVLMMVKALSEAVRIKKSLGRKLLCFGAYGVQPFTDSRVVQ
jgi:hypothetical protein